jgi:hypothetical protein
VSSMIVMRSKSASESWPFKYGRMNSSNLDSPWISGIHLKSPFVAKDTLDRQKGPWMGKTRRS